MIISPTRDTGSAIWPLSRFVIISITGRFGNETMVCTVRLFMSLWIVIWSDCFVEHSCPGGFVPNLVPCHWLAALLYALLTIDTWQVCFHLYTFPWLCVWEGCINILLAHGQDLAPVLMPVLMPLPFTGKHKPHKGSWVLCGSLFKLR